jgi:hypothetical protein
MDESNRKLCDDALRRMRRAHERGTGCRLTAEMLNAVSVTLIGQWWGELKPGKIIPGGRDEVLDCPTCGCQYREDDFAEGKRHLASQCPGCAEMDQED